MRRHARGGRRAGTAAVAAMLASAPLGAQSARADTTGFVVVRGADTLAVERIVRTPDRVAGELAVRAAGLRQTFDLALRADGTVARLTSEVHRLGAPAGTPAAQALAADFGADGVTLRVGGEERRHAAPAGTLPFINLSAASLDQILRRARALGGERAEVPVVALAGLQNLVAAVRWVGADSAVVSLGVELRARVAADGALLGAEVPAQGVRFVRTAALPTAAGTPPDYSAPPGAPYAAEAVRVPNAAAGVQLAGTLTVPRRADGRRVPAVLLLTGSGPQDRDEASPALPGWRPFRQIADTLGRRGIAVLRLDDRGVGGSDAGPPGATTADLAADARAAVAWLRARPEIDPARVAVLGHSEGATIATMVAADDARLRGAVLVAGTSRTGRRISDAQVAQAFDERGLTGAARDSARRANDAARDSLVAASPWVRFFFDFDPLPTARRVRVPVLVLHGATDRQVSADQAEETAAAVRAGGNRDVTVRVLPDLNHLLVHDPSGAFAGYRSLPSYAVRADVLGALADWLAARLR